MSIIPELPDVQKRNYGFPHLSIERVGTENIKTELPIRTKSGEVKTVLANVRSYCSLTSDLKGINMSRIGQTVFDVAGKNRSNGFASLMPFVKELMAVHDDGTETVFISAMFDWLLNSRTPVTGLYAPKSVQVTMAAAADQQESHTYLTVHSTEMSLCPCSKEMSMLENQLTGAEMQELQALSPELRKKILASGFGAHNQKSDITIAVEMKSGSAVDIETLADIIAKSASSPTFSILKRPDEKWVTEAAYMGGTWENGKFKETGGGPRFVEDIVRRAAGALEEQLDKSIADYMVHVRNQESIHSDGIAAAAMICAGRRLQWDIVTGRE